ncbi:YuiB family protein [Brevibacillus fulvus]|uniref:Membrane protein YdbS with pleckstrin-like domain n=1 Tax=Brevibacillus fulvus TaxID=1125967 RepID=A0A939BWP8_9BACL|nr:YuiB family protein [Brevibacillus fulvus]MBM7592006.1 membrane protein YdbS with pleckstrin-like domain [Brevibacillus fulvus]
MPLSPIQFVISIVLFCVLGFGIGFILNMILRTTWLPVAVAIIVIVGALAYNQIVPGLIDVIILAFGMAGTIASGLTIHTLRKKGYRMF